MTKLAIIPFTVLLETIFLKKQFSLPTQSRKSSCLLYTIAVPICSISSCDSFSTDPSVDQFLAKKNVLSFNYTPPIMGFIRLSCSIAVIVNFTTFLVIGKASPVTFQVLGHLQTCLVLAFGYTLLHDSFNERNIMGMLIAIAGMGMNSYFCNKEIKNKQIIDISTMSQSKDGDKTPFPGSQVQKSKDSAV